jgi:hypothetical protein
MMSLGISSPHWFCVTCHDTTNHRSLKAFSLPELKQTKQIFKAD